VKEDRRAVVGLENAAELRLERAVDAAAWIVGGAVTR
jgi:hypothetical protein